MFSRRATAVMCILLAACGSASRPVTARADHGVSATPTGHVATLAVTSRKNWFIPEPGVLLVTGFGQWITYGAGTTRDVADHIELLDTKTGLRRVIARTQYIGGQIGWLTASGDYVVWLDASRVPDDTNPNVSWVVYEEDVRYGTQRVLARSTSPQEVVPLPSARDGKVGWLEQDGGEGVLKFGDLATGQMRIVGRPSAADGVDVPNGHSIVYANHSEGHSDIVLLDVNTQRQSRLTTTGKATEPQGNEQWITWNQPDGTWFMRTDPRNSAVNVSGGQDLGNAVAGPGWAAWWAGSDVEVGDQSGHRLVVDHNLAVEARMSSDGSNLIYGTETAEEAQTGQDVGTNLVLLTISGGSSR